MWSSSPSVWREHLSHYSSALSSRESTANKPDLVTLDRFVWRSLPVSISARPVRHITAPEYAKLVRWKLKRGKWRPRLQAFADAATHEQVARASEAAFTALGVRAVDRALKALVSLKGCGPATASAVLAAVDAQLPFMSDELLLETQPGSKKYTVAAYLELVDAVQAKVNELNAADDSHVWTAREVEQAVFASYHYVESDSAVAASAAEKDVTAEPKKTGGHKRPRALAKRSKGESPILAPTTVNQTEGKLNESDEQAGTRPRRRQKLSKAQGEQSSSAEGQVRRSARTRAKSGR